MALLALPASRSSGRAVDYARGRSHGFDTLRAHPLCESISSGQIMLAINHPPAAQLLTGGNLFEDEAKGLRRRRVSTRNTLRCKRLCVSVKTHTHKHFLVLPHLLHPLPVRSMRCQWIEGLYRAFTHSAFTHGSHSQSQSPAARYPFIVPSTGVESGDEQHTHTHTQTRAVWCGPHHYTASHLDSPHVGKGRRKRTTKHHKDTGWRWWRWQSVWFGILVAAAGGCDGRAEANPEQSNWLCHNNTQQTLNMSDYICRCERRGAEFICAYTLAVATHWGGGDTAQEWDRSLSSVCVCGREMSFRFSSFFCCHQ